MTEKISSIIDLFDRFETEQDCIRYIYEQRTEPGWTCPRCGAPAPSLLLSRRKIQCTRCSHQESRALGTAMEGSHIKLKKQIVAIYLVANDKRGGLKAQPGLDQRAFNADDGAASLPLVHHVISNFKSHIRRTYRGVTRDHLRSCADEFCWRYNHRGMKAKFELLLADLCRRAKRQRRQIPLLFMLQVVPLNKAA